MSTWVLDRPVCKWFDSHLWKLDGDEIPVVQCQHPQNGGSPISGFGNCHDLGCHGCQFYQEESHE